MPLNKGNPTNLGWSNRDTFFCNCASHRRSRFSKNCVLKGPYNWSVSCVTCVVFGTQGYKMNPKHLSLVRRLRFILPGPLSSSTWHACHAGSLHEGTVEQLSSCHTSQTPHYPFRPSRSPQTWQATSAVLYIQTALAHTACAPSHHTAVSLSPSSLPYLEIGGEEGWDRQQHCCRWSLLTFFWIVRAVILSLNCWFLIKSETSYIPPFFPFSLE